MSSVIDTQVQAAAFRHAHSKKAPGNIEKWIDIGHADEAKTHPLSGNGISAVVDTVQRYCLVTKQHSELSADIRLPAGRAAPRRRNHGDIDDLGPPPHLLGSCQPGDSACNESRMTGEKGRATMHAMGAERIWTERMLGRPTLPFPKAADYPDLDAIRNGWKPIADALRDFALGCSEADLARVFSFRRLNGDQYTGMVAECILQVINHGTQHGAEIAQMLTEIGRSPGEIDLLRYIRARDARIAGGG